jgi:hypothetical protein
VGVLPSGDGPIFLLDGGDVVVFEGAAAVCREVAPWMVWLRAALEEYLAATGLEIDEARAFPEFAQAAAEAIRNREAGSR